MRISRKADYALRAVVHLAQLPKDTLGSINSISESESIPREFLAKILRELTQSGILKSHQGVKGGYALARKSSSISFLDVMEAMDGPVHLSLCTQDEDCGCDKNTGREMHKFWESQEKIYKRTLRQERFSKYSK